MHRLHPEIIGSWATGGQHFRRISESASNDITTLPRPMNEPQTIIEGTSDFFTVPELAAYLRISRPTVYRLVERRDIVFYRFPRGLRFMKKDVEAYLESCRVASIAETMPKK